MTASVDKHIAKFARAVERGICFERGLVKSFVDDITFDIAENGDRGQVEDLLSAIPKLDDMLRTTLSKYVLEPDNSIFCRWVLCSPPFPTPDDWRHPPTQVRANIDDSTDPVIIVVECDDGTSFTIPPNDPVRAVVFALRNYFAEHYVGG